MMESSYLEPVFALCYHEVRSQNWIFCNKKPYYFNELQETFKISFAVYVKTASTRFFN